MRTSTWLEKWSLWFAFIPWFLFLLGWLRPVFSLPLCGFLLWGIIRAGYGVTLDGISLPLPNASRDKTGGLVKMAFAFLVIFGIVFVSGIGGFGAQLDHDFHKHNSFLRDLVERPWPLWYDKTGTDNIPGFLTTYVGLYLPAAFVGKLFGWTAANWALVLWVSTGVFLAHEWLVRLVGRRSFALLFLLLFFGGLDVLGWLLLHGLDGGVKAMANCLYLDWWVLATAGSASAEQILRHVYVFVPSNTTSLVVGFHHIVPGWLLTMMVLHEAVYRRTTARLGLLWAAAAVGSAFVTVGLIPLLALAAWQTKLHRAFNFNNLVIAPALLLVSALFFVSNNGGFAKGWLWEFQNLGQSWPFLLVIWVLEFGLYIAACPVSFNEERLRVWKPWWRLAIACSVLFPLYHIGRAGDFPAKAYIPTLIILQTVFAITLLHMRHDWQRQAARWMVFLLLLGSIGGIRTVTQHLDSRLGLTPVPLSHVVHINEITPKRIAAQLFSRGDAFFWHFLARVPATAAHSEHIPSERIIPARAERTTRCQSR